MTQYSLQTYQCTQYNSTNNQLYCHTTQIPHRYVAWPIRITMLTWLSNNFSTNAIRRAFSPHNAPETINLPRSTRTSCWSSRRSPNLGTGTRDKHGYKGEARKVKILTTHNTSTSIISRDSDEMAYLVGRWCGCGHVVVRCCPVRLRTCQTDPWSCD